MCTCRVCRAAVWLRTVQTAYVGADAATLYVMRLNESRGNGDGSDPSVVVHTTVMSRVDGTRDHCDTSFPFSTDEYAGGGEFTSRRLCHRLAKSAGVTLL